jgi:hypothetical protein
MNGQFIAAWAGYDSEHVFFNFQRFDAENVPIGDVVPIKDVDPTREYPLAISISRTPGGNLVVAWLDEFAHAVFERVFDQYDTPLGDAQLVAEVDNQVPEVCTDDSGDFVMAWEWKHLGSDNSVQFRRYDAQGQAATPVLNSGLSVDSAIACLPLHTFVIAAIGGGYDVVIRAFDADNRPVGRWAIPDSFAWQIPAIAALPDNQFVVAWTQSFCTDALCDVFLQHFALAPGVECAGDCNGDQEVTIDEILGVIFLSLYDPPDAACRSISQCPAVDMDLDCHASVDEIVAAIDHALRGCE